MIACATSSVAATITGETTLGRMWRRMMRWGAAPMDRAASTYSRSFSASTSPRTMRAVCIHEVAPMATTIRVKAPSSGPRTLAIRSRNNITMTSSSGISGRARNMSVSRISGPSSRRKYPARMPMNVPSVMAMIMATKPTASDTLPACIILCSMSRPSWSVPSGYCSDGAWLRTFIACATVSFSGAQR